MANRSLVIAVDNTMECLLAIDFVLEHLPKGYKYQIVHVVPRPLPGISPNREKVAETEEYMNKFFIPRAAMGQADEVVGTILESEPDGSRATGKAICEYVAKIDADALVLMRMQKSSLDRFFLGSVTEYCAKHCRKPVIIVPQRAY